MAEYEFSYMNVVDVCFDSHVDFVIIRNVSIVRDKATNTLKNFDVLLTVHLSI